MNWTKVSAIAEIVSSIAILATLAYLAIQTQQNTAAIISNSRQQSLNADLRVLRLIADYPVADFSEPRTEGKAGIRQQMADYMLFRIRENQWLQYQDGQLDAATWRAYLGVLVNNIRSSDRLMQRWDQTETLDPQFVSAVNERLQGNDP